MATSCDEHSKINLIILKFILGLKTGLGNRGDASHLAIALYNETLLGGFSDLNWKIFSLPARINKSNEQVRLINRLVNKWRGSGVQNRNCHLQCVLVAKLAIGRYSRKLEVSNFMNLLKA